MLVQRIQLSDDEGNFVEIGPISGDHFSVTVRCREINGGQSQSIYVTTAMLRQLSRMLKFLETPL